MTLEADAILDPKAGFHVARCTLEWLPRAWKYIRHGLEQVKKNCPTSTWIPEQIRKVLERDMQNGGPAELFICYEGQRVVGFYIMLTQIDPWLSIPYVWLVWMAYSSGKGLVDQITPIIIQHARERGFVAVDFVTANTKLVRHMESHGCQTVMITSRKMVE